VGISICFSTSGTSPHTTVVNDSSAMPIDRRERFRSFRSLTQI
jgi:hypothetical protein